MAGPRSRAVGPWTEVQSIELFDEENNPFKLIVELGDMKDTWTGAIYPRGSYKVHCERTQIMRAKSFCGEMAWINATRYVRDALSAAGYWREATRFEIA